MKRKLLSVVLSLSMVAVCATGCGEKPAEAPAETGEKESVETPADTEDQGSTEVAASEIPQDYKYYFSFDEPSESVHYAKQFTGETPIVQAVEDEPIYISGVKGNALFVDGVRGGKLDVNGVGDTYTVSFWVYGARTAQHMPTLQYGPDIHGDATGSEHWVNFTWEPFNPDDTSALPFPIVWSYDAANTDRINWYPDYLESRNGEWLNITLLVDGNVKDSTGNYLAGRIFVNGEELVNYDNDGNLKEVTVVNGTMAQSDNFEMLLGINYWDSILKGAFDEIYIYDYVLDDAQVKALFEAGDVNAKYEEPPRDIVVLPEEGALASLGATDYSVADDVYAEDIAIADGDTVKIKMKHWSDGKDSSHNYYFSFKDADGKEVARLNADMTGTVGSDAIADSAFNWSWSNWEKWESFVMVETAVTSEITYADGKITAKIDNVDYNGTSNTATAEFEVADVSSFAIGTVNSYTDILSVGNAEFDPNIYYFYGVDGSYIVNDPVLVGAEDGSSAFWSEHSQTIAVPAGESKTLGFTVKTAGADNWNNVFAVLQNVAGVHSADVIDDYKEYAVLRADNYGWGDSYPTATLDTNWNFDTMAAEIAGAHVELTVTNNGDTADAVFNFTTTEGKEYYQSYTGIAIDGDLFFCVGVDGSCLELDSTSIGAEDGSSGFWSAWSEVVAVAPGTSQTSEFTVEKAGADNWNNVFAAVTNAAYGYAASDRYPDYAEYAVFRADNYGWGDCYGTATPETNWDFDTMAAKMNGAHVVLTVTNNGDTTDVEFNITTADGEEYFQKYTGMNTAH